MTERRSDKPCRSAISKTVRFEVFKRDSFQCRYCGASAPDVLLQIDHIKPVAGGGNNEITNLITACAACNAGKKDRPLDDSTVIKKKKAQLNELHERREQLEMMMEWAESLQDLKGQCVSSLADYWAELAPGYVLNDQGLLSIKKWLRRFQFAEITHAMGIAADQYLEFQDDGTVTKESWECAFDKVPGICGVVRDSESDPDLRELFYIRGIVQNKCADHFDKEECLELLRGARECDVPLQKLRQSAYRVKSWTHFKEIVGQLADDQ